MPAMTPQQFIADLHAASSQPSSTRAQTYRDLLIALLDQPRSSLSAAALVQACSDYLDTTVFADLNSSGGGLVVGRNALSGFDEAITKTAAAAAATGGDDGEDDPSRPAVADEEVQKEILEAALTKVQPRVLSFEEQASSLRLHLADIHESLGDWTAAAQVLSGIPLDSGHRSVSELTKLRIYVRIARLLLEADDAVGADAHLKRASMVVHAVPGTNVGLTSNTSGSSSANAPETSSSDEIKEGKVLGLQFKLCQARIYDAQRRFAEAAVRFHELSYVADIDEEERTMMLSAAVTASILAPAGPQRSRILGTLVRDERVSGLPQATILSRVFLDQIVGPGEVAAFEELLQPHQKAQLAKTGNEREMLRLEEEAQQREAGSGESTDATMVPASASSATTPIKTAPTTVLDRAMMEHNILASSKLYMNITLAGLGSLLSLTPNGAETMVRRMIGQGRLHAELDQVDGVLTFLEKGDAAPTAGGLGIGTGGAAGDGSQDASAAGGTDGSSLAASGGMAVTTSNPIGVGDGLVRRWDAQIAKTASGLEDVCVRIAAVTGS